MKKTLSTHDIANAFRDDKNADWSWNGAVALAEYLEECEEDTGEEMELDVVAIRCDFSEYESLEGWAGDYFRDSEEAIDSLNLTNKRAIAKLGLPFFDNAEESDDEISEAIRDFIRDNGQLIEFDGGVIVSSF